MTWSAVGYQLWYSVMNKEEKMVVTLWDVLSVKFLYKNM